MKGYLPPMDEEGDGPESAVDDRERPQAPIDLRPAILSAVGGGIVLLTILVQGRFDELSTWLILLGAALALGGTWWFRLRALQPDRVFEQEKAQLMQERDQADRERRALDLYKADVEEEALVLERRRHKLSLQLTQTVGWWDLVEGNDTAPKDPDEGASTTPGVSTAESDEREREVLAFCRAESERLFNKVIENGYVKDGVLQPEEIYKDVTQLFEGVARIYQPNSDQPLLETSVEQILRFLHNVSLQLLVQLEQLPVDVKSFNIRETYRFMKRAMDYYGMYKKVNPYWNYAKPAIFLSRFALGANPIALGLGWTLTELASLGGKKLSSRYTRKYGLRMFHESIRIIGSETAAVYGANFRDRDPDWVFATELIELVHHFPPSRDSLEASLKEMGQLALHSEYDRVYLYRCLANRFSAKPRSSRTQGLISMADSVQVAKKLEGLFHQFYAHEEPDRVEKWRRGLETRLGVKLQLQDRLVQPVSSSEERLSAFYSLASYLLGHKMLELDAAESRLTSSRTASALEAEALTKGLLRIRQAPPMVFDYPDHALSKPMAHDYLHDLIDFQLTVFPRESSKTLIEESAAYFREKPATWLDEIDTHCRDFVTGQLLPEAPKAHIDSRTARALLGHLAPDERLHFLYPVSGVEGSITFQRAFKSLILLGSNRHPLSLVGFSEDAQSGLEAIVLWHVGGAPLTLDHSKTFLTQAYRLQGGTWDESQATLDSAESAPLIRLRSRRGSSQDGHFDLLLDRVDQLQGHTEARTSNGRGALDELGESGSLS